MNRILALAFAFGGVILLLGISFFASLRNGWGVLAAGIGAVLFIGSGFMLKARTRRHNRRG